MCRAAVSRGSGVENKLPQVLNAGVGLFASLTCFYCFALVLFLCATPLSSLSPSPSSSPSCRVKCPPRPPPHPLSGVQRVLGSLWSPHNEILLSFVWPLFISEVELDALCDFVLTSTFAAWIGGGGACRAKGAKASTLSESRLLSNNQSA